MTIRVSITCGKQSGKFYGEVSFTELSELKDARTAGQQLLSSGAAETYVLLKSPAMAATIRLEPRNGPTPDQLAAAAAAANAAMEE